MTTKTTNSPTPMLAKRQQAMRDRAADYEQTFGFPLADRIRGLLNQYPDVQSPNWLSWEGHRFTNAATTAALRRWLGVLEGAA